MKLTPIEHWRTIDEYKKVLPWYTRPCLEWLITLRLSGKRVFEYGCGQSSIWYKERGAIVYGIDDKPEWCFLGQPNTENKYRYIRGANDRTTKYDIVIIDGIYRDDCTEDALKGLKKGGYLIVDNFEQASADLPDWPKTRELTKNLPLTLYKEPEHIDWKTAVWRNV